MCIDTRPVTKFCLAYIHAILLSISHNNIIFRSKPIYLNGNLNNLFRLNDKVIWDQGLFSFRKGLVYIYI